MLARLKTFFQFPATWYPQSIGSWAAKFRFTLRRQSNTEPSAGSAPTDDIEQNTTPSIDVSESTADENLTEQSPVIPGYFARYRKRWTQLLSFFKRGGTRSIDNDHTEKSLNDTLDLSQRPAERHTLDESVSANEVPQIQAPVESAPAPAVEPVAKPVNARNRIVDDETTEAPSTGTGYFTRCRERLSRFISLFRRGTAGQIDSDSAAKVPDDTLGPTSQPAARRKLDEPESDDPVSQEPAPAQFSKFFQPIKKAFSFKKSIEPDLSESALKSDAGAETDSSEKAPSRFGKLLQTIKKALSFKKSIASEADEAALDAPSREKELPSKGKRGLAEAADEDAQAVVPAQRKKLTLKRALAIFTILALVGGLIFAGVAFMQSVLNEQKAKIEQLEKKNLQLKNENKKIREEKQEKRKVGATDTTEPQDGHKTRSKSPMISADCGISKKDQVRELLRKCIDEFNNASKAK